MRRNLTIFMAVLFILLVHGESKASLFRTFLKFTEIDNHTQMPSSESPVPSLDHKAELVVTTTDERCEISSCLDLKDVTACLSHAGSGPQGSFLIVQNDGETLVKVNLTFLPSNMTITEIELEKHKAKKINISANAGGSESIILNAGNGNCRIYMGSPAPEDNAGKQTPSFATYANPLHGAYLLAFVVLITGGACACIKLRKRGRHLDGVPYQELEMGQPESLSSVKVETAEGWDQDWDEDWDVEKAMKSPGRKRLRNGHANGIASRSSKDDGWGNDWND